MTTTMEVKAEVERRLTAAEDKADRAEKASVTTTNALLTIDREVRAIRREVTVGFVTLRDQIREIKQPRERELFSLSEEDFEKTDAGQHYRITRDKVERILSSRELAADARKARDWIAG